MKNHLSLIFLSPASSKGLNYCQKVSPALVGLRGPVNCKDKIYVVTGNFMAVLSLGGLRTHVCSGSRDSRTSISS